MKKQTSEAVFHGSNKLFILIFLWCLDLSIIRNKCSLFDIVSSKLSHSLLLNCPFQITRTVKFLSAISVVHHIVTPLWIEDSNKAGTLLGAVNISTLVFIWMSLISRYLGIVNST